MNTMDKVINVMGEMVEMVCWVLPLSGLILVTLSAFLIGCSV